MTVVERLIVLRIAPDFPVELVPSGWEGNWWKADKFPQNETPFFVNGVLVAVVRRTHRFERRDPDGATARVYEIGFP